MVLVWTHDEAARDALALALSRFGYPFRMMSGPAEVAGAIEQGADRHVLVLGPSFTRSEAEGLRKSLPESVAVVLLEDMLDPLPADVVSVTEPIHRRLLVPVRARTLRELLASLLVG